MGAQGKKVLSCHVNKVVFGICLSIGLIKGSASAGQETLSAGDAAAHVDTIPFKIVRIVQKKVDVLFKGLIWNPFRRPEYEPNFNWGWGNKTQYVPVGESLHGYTVGPLEKRTIEVEEPGQPPRKEERYFITLRRPGDDPVVIQMGKTAPVTERIAALEATKRKWRVFHRGERLSEGEKVFDVFEGCVICEMEGDRRKFTVARVNDETLALEELYEHVLRVPSPIENSIVEP